MIVHINSFDNPTLYGKEYIKNWVLKHKEKRIIEKDKISLGMLYFEYNAIVGDFGRCAFGSVSVQASDMNRITSLFWNVMENLNRVENLIDYYDFLLEGFGVDILKLKENEPHLFL